MPIGTTTTQLLASIKSRAMLPTSQSTFIDEQILALADDEIRSKFFDLIVSANAGYYTHSEDCPIDGTHYRIPRRAGFMKLQRVVLVNDKGDEVSVPLIDENQLGRIGLLGFYIQQNHVVFTCVPSGYSYVRLYYHIRPSKLIKESQAAKVSSIYGNNVTVTNLPSAITSTSIVDFVRADPGYEAIAIDRSISTINATTLTFDSVPDSLAVGDYICLAGETPVVQLPEEAMPVLAQSVAVKILEAVRDSEGVQVAQAKLMELEKHFVNSIQPRVSGQNRKIINRNSQLRRHRYYFGF